MMNSSDLGKNLRAVIDKAKPRLLEIPTSKFEFKPGLKKWSKKEILGHLIDSASNNHQRFVRAQFKEDLVFDGYSQDDWVKSQAYHQASFQDLVDLWYLYNFHLSHVIDNIPSEILYQKNGNHNFDKIAFITVPADQVSSLDYFISDYILHLEHHLKQIFQD